MYQKLNTSHRHPLAVGYSDKRYVEKLNRILYMPYGIRIIDFKQFFPTGFN